jgi:protein Tex
MNDKHIIKISKELNLKENQVFATAKLLSEDATVPFIARYRKELTESLDEVEITAIRDRLAQLDELDKRREAILKSLEERELLTDELKEKIEAAETLTELEDIYLPFRPKKRTRATIAKEKGLEPLAATIFEQENIDLYAEAEKYIDTEKSVNSTEEALAGARDIIAEWVNENKLAREKTRELFERKAFIFSKVAKDKEEEGIKYKDYYDWKEQANSAPSHRLLAMYRGENEGFLRLNINPDEDEAVEILNKMFVKNFSTVESVPKNSASEQVLMSVKDCYKRLLSLSIETEFRNLLKEKADRQAILVFADNLRQLLLAPPLGEKNILALDPGFRTGCKVVCLDRQGKLLHNETIYPHTGAALKLKAGETIIELVNKFHTEIVAVGNGTAGRETEEFVRTVLERASEVVPNESAKADLQDVGNEVSLKNIPVVMVNESGASIYSASEVAREEFPDYDVTVRGSVSIGRRLIDPLAELVKIDPKSIGVGQYQHDVNQTMLKQKLDDVVMSCVNGVGVEVNTASKQLLTYVSGLGPKLAQSIVEFRNENGAFKSREELKKVARLKNKAFEQAAGFLRIRNGENPLDASAVHPESYHIVEKMATDIGCTVKELISFPQNQAKIDVNKYISDTVGLPTLEDIKAELAKPGRDPRERFEIFEFAKDVGKLEDLKPGMKLPGIVTNITNFGAFVDIGVHQDGLVHISQIADGYIKNPADILKVAQRVTVTVVEIDLTRKRIQLSMRSGKEKPAEKKHKKFTKEDADKKLKTLMEKYNKEK